MPSAPKNLLSRQQKLFKMNHILPLDANNLDVEEAISRLFVYLRTNGRQITRTDKVVFMPDSDHAETPKAVVDAVLSNNGEKLKGIDSEERRDLVTSWVESHFALMARRGKTRGGDYRMSGLRPLHFSVIKLFNPQVKRQDRYLSDFFYNILKDDTILYSQPDSLLKQFFGLGVRFYGDNDFRIDESELDQLASNNRLDVELLFLLRLTEPFDADKFSNKKEDTVPNFSFLCPEQIDLLCQDLKLLFLYKDHIPRRELINYMTTLMVFHAALYFFQVVKISNAMVQQGKIPSARGPEPRVGEVRNHAPFDLDIFCDLTNGHDPVVKDLSERGYTALFKEVEAYFRSAYFMKKLEEFAQPYLTPAQQNQTGKTYIELLLQGFRNHSDLNGHFNRDIQTVMDNGKDHETGETHEDVQRIVDVCNQRGLNKLETFVEILVHFQYGTLREQHRKLIAGLCGIDQERGFLAGKGRIKRRFVIGNELLEVLIQLAVLEQRKSDGKFQTRPIPIRQFVDWLAGRYGLLVDQQSRSPNGPEEERVNRALAKNYEALKTRLRQLGFFTDLADASNSQVISPRFPIDEAQISAQNDAA
jgi:hypothetical protein